MGVWDQAADLLTADLRPSYMWNCGRDECDGAPHGEHSQPHGRTKQRIPAGDWSIWLLLTGRGWGKTRTGSECFLDLILDTPLDIDGRPTEWLVAGPTHDDTIKLLMEGVSSLSHALNRRGVAYRYNKNEKLITIATGQRIVLTNAEDEDLGRGGNWSGVWLDEAGMFKRIKYAWYESLVPSVRAKLPEGKRPRILITTTPKVRRRDAFEILRDLRHRDDDSVFVTIGSTFENEANLDPSAVEQWRKLYPEGSRAYRQEFLAELTDEVEGALWRQEVIDSYRVNSGGPSSLTRVCVSVDPAATSNPDSDDTGIIVAGIQGHPRDGDYYVLADHTTHGTPDEWGKSAVAAWERHEADCIVYETNQGGEMVRSVLLNAARDLYNRGDIDVMPRLVPVRATRGKAVRAEPIAALYEQGRVHHCGPFPQLEEQLTTWTPEERESPDRLDALVWALTYLSTRGKPNAPVTLQHL